MIVRIQSPPPLLTTKRNVMKVNEKCIEKQNKNDYYCWKRRRRWVLKVGLQWFLEDQNVVSIFACCGWRCVPGISASYSHFRLAIKRFLPLKPVNDHHRRWKVVSFQSSDRWLRTRIKTLMKRQWFTHSRKLS